jgi:hypothetical protein
MILLILILILLFGGGFGSFYAYNNMNPLAGSLGLIVVVLIVFLLLRWR